MSQPSSTPVAFDKIRDFSARALGTNSSAVKPRYGALRRGMVIAGVFLRVGVTILAGSGMRTPWGGGGDTPAYVLLAQNILSGKGYAYAGMPTALRAPGYPLMLALFFKLFHTHALLAMRWLQCFEGFAVVLLCAAAAKKLLGEEAAKWTLALALFFPTLVQMNGEILSEALATLFAALFIYLLVVYVKAPRWTWVLGLSCAIGLGSLVRFNLAALGIVGVAAVYVCSHGSERWRNVSLLAALSILIVSPWLVRNWAVFHGEEVFSTHSGLDALEGVLTPQGRALPGDSEMLRAAVGWVPPVDVETNEPSRLRLGPEPELDKQCWRAAIAIAEYKGWALVPLALGKIANFWLSTDQLFWTGSFPLWDRVLRAGGVLVYWAALALALFAWLRLRLLHPRVTQTFLLYAVLVTIMHLPFVMSTRLRMPFMSPLVAILAGCGVAILLGGNPEKNPPVWAMKPTV